MELYKTANAQIMLVVESLFSGPAGDGDKVYNKIALVLVQRDQANRAVKTVKYYLDVPAAKVIFSDVWGPGLSEHSEYKKLNGQERGLNLQNKDGGLRVSILNRATGSPDKDTLFFDLSRFQARSLAVTVLDHIRAWEIARAFDTTAKADRGCQDE